MKWLRESNRLRHLKGIFLISLFGTFLMGVGCIGGMEFKDCHHVNGDTKPIREWDWSAWDWLDIAAGLIGAFLATLVQVGIVLLILLLLKH